MLDNLRDRHITFPKCNIQAYPLGSLLRINKNLSNLMNHIYTSKIYRNYYYILYDIDQILKNREMKLKLTKLILTSLVCKFF